MRETPVEDRGDIEDGETWKTQETCIEGMHRIHGRLSRHGHAWRTHE